MISNELIARADPDGHTIGFGHIGTLVISPTIQKCLTPFTRISRRSACVVSLQNIIVVNPTVPAKNLQEYSRPR